MHVDVHYFEAGNVSLLMFTLFFFCRLTRLDVLLQVQLSTSQAFDLPLPPKGSDQAGKIVGGISKLEAEYQLKLAETNQQFGEKEFRS